MHMFHIGLFGQNRPLKIRATEVVRFECWQLTAEGEETGGGGKRGGEEGEEGEEEGEERGEDGATSGRLRKGPALRTTHASAAMRDS